MGFSSFLYPSGERRKITGEYISQESQQIIAWCCWRRSFLSVRKPRRSAHPGMAGHCKRGVAGALTKSPWVVTLTSPFCFQTRRLPVLLFEWWKFIDVQSNPYQGPNGWCRDQKWLDVRMSRTSSTAVCESRMAVHLNFSKGSKMTRVTPSSIVVDCFDFILIKNFCPKKILVLCWISKQKCYPHYRKIRLCFCDMKPYGTRKVK